MGNCTSRETGSLIGAHVKAPVLNAASSAL